MKKQGRPKGQTQFHIDRDLLILERLSENMTLEEIGREFNMTRQNVSRIALNNGISRKKEGCRRFACDKAPHQVI